MKAKAAGAAAALPAAQALPTADLAASSARSAGTPIAVGAGPADQAPDGRADPLTLRHANPDFDGAAAFGRAFDPRRLGRAFGYEPVQSVPAHPRQQLVDVLRFDPESRVLVSAGRKSIELRRVGADGRLDEKPFQIVSVEGDLSRFVNDARYDSRGGYLWTAEGSTSANGLFGRRILPDGRVEPKPSLRAADEYPKAFFLDRARGFAVVMHGGLKTRRLEADGALGAVLDELPEDWNKYGGFSQAFYDPADRLLFWGDVRLHAARVGADGRIGREPIDTFEPALQHSPLSNLTYDPARRLLIYATRWGEVSALRVAKSGRLSRQPVWTLRVPDAQNRGIGNYFEAGAVFDAKTDSVIALRDTASGNVIDVIASEPTSRPQMPRAAPESRPSDLPVDEEYLSPASGSAGRSPRADRSTRRERRRR